MRIATACLVASMALLSACSKSQTTAAGVSPPASPVPAALLTRPHPRPGLWQMSMTSAFGPTISLNGQICLDAQTEDAAFQTGPMTQSKNCTPPRFAPAPDSGLALDTVCKSDGRTITVHAVLSGDFQNAYAMDVSSRVSPAPTGMPAELKTHIASRWIGPCKPGQAPGHIAFKLSGFGRG
jgi:hypothetical protein